MARMTVVFMVHCSDGDDNDAVTGQDRMMMTMRAMTSIL